jgi:hypothetical protein
MAISKSTIAQVIGLVTGQSPTVIENHLSDG